MAFAWPDPPAPVCDENGQPPQWLELRDYPTGVGRSWHCGLCNLWAEPSHLLGQKHLSNIAWLKHRQSSQAIVEQQQPARRPQPPPPLQMPTQPTQLSNVQQPDASGVQGVQPGGARPITLPPVITSLAQLAPEVIEALMEMLMSRLNRAAAQQPTPTAAAPNDANQLVGEASRSNSSGDSGYIMP